jgi:DNA-binding transcriptional LysR family regulator
VSAQVRQLERELGQALLDRSGRTVRLTEVGAAVLPHARAALGAVAAARVAVDDLTGLVRGHVTVGIVGSISSLDVPGLLAGFHRDHPTVEIALTEANSDRLVEALQAGQIDLAFLALPATPPPGVEVQVVADEPLVVAVSRDDALATRTTITLQAIRERALITLTRGTGLRSYVDGAFATAGFQPRIAFEAGDPHVLARLAGRGLGVAILPRSVADAHAAELHVIALTRPRLRGRIALAWRAQGPTSPAARALISHAGTVLGQPEPG